MKAQIYDGEDSRLVVDVIDDQLASMLVAFVGKRIYAAEKGAECTA